MNPTFSIVIGSEVTKNDLDIVNFLRKQEFNSEIPIIPKSDNEDWTNKFFFAKDSTGKILAFAILRITNVEFRQKNYPVLEFISLMAVEKRKGYGALLLNKIGEHSRLLGKTFLGFCISELIPFYLKAGLEILPSTTDRFIFRKDQRSFPDETPGVAIFVSGADGLIEEMRKYPKETAYLTRHKKN